MYCRASPSSFSSSSSPFHETAESSFFCSSGSLRLLRHVTVVVVAEVVESVGVCVQGICSPIDGILKIEMEDLSSSCSTGVFVMGEVWKGGGVEKN